MALDRARRVLSLRAFTLFSRVNTGKCPTVLCPFRGRSQAPAPAERSWRFAPGSGAGSWAFSRSFSMGGKPWGEEARTCFPAAPAAPGAWALCAGQGGLQSAGPCPSAPVPRAPAPWLRWGRGGEPAGEDGQDAGQKAPAGVGPRSCPGDTVPSAIPHPPCPTADTHRHLLLSLLQVGENPPFPPAAQGLSTTKRTFWNSPRARSVPRVLC